MRNWILMVLVFVIGVYLLPGCSAGKQGEGSGTTSNSGAIGKTDDDAAITKAVQDKIDAEATLKSAGIKAKANGGQVELIGTVKTIPDKDKAEEIAREAIKPYSNINAGILNNISIAEDNQAPSSEPPGSSGKK